MTLIKAADAPTFTIPGVTVTGLASPSRGARETSAWRVVVAPGSEGGAHTVDREEIFVALSGTALATVAGEQHELAAGDALIVPPGIVFSLANPHDEPFEAVAAQATGGRATLPGGDPFSPPWTE